MANKKDSRGRKRNYKNEYRRDHASKASKDARARRNKARRDAVKKGQVKKGDNKEVHHPAGNARGRGVVVSRTYNRSKAQRGKKR